LHFACIKRKKNEKLRLRQRLRRNSSAIPLAKAQRTQSTQREEKGLAIFSKEKIKMKREKS
jgi:hypothetical protein